MPPSKQLRDAKEKVVGTTVLSPSPGQVSSATQAHDLPTWRNAASCAQLVMMELPCHLEDGTEAVRRHKEKYLPKSPAEGQDDYERRVKVAELYNMFLRAVRGLTGMPFRRNPVLSPELPEVFRTVHWLNIDNAGTHGSVFAKETFERGLVRGHVGVFVDHPEAPPGLRLADEQELGLRPYWVPVYPHQILNWRTMLWQGRLQLAQLTIEGSSVQPIGRFGEQERPEWRVYRWIPPMDRTPAQVHWELWQPDAKGQPMLVRTGVIRNQKRIPFAVSYLGRKLGILSSQPPLLELAHTTISHYRVLSDHRYSLHKASIPLLVAIGRPNRDEDVVVGVNQAIDIPIGGDLKYVEHAGSALGQSRTELQDIENRAAAQGLAFLQRESRAAETAEARMIDKAEQDSALATAAFGHQLMLQELVRFHLEYMGVEAPVEEELIKLNVDFRELSYDPAMIASLHQLRIAGDISQETLWDLLQSGNILPQTFDRDLERTRLAAMQKEDLAQMEAEAALLPPAPTGQEGAPPPKKGEEGSVTA